jgi:coiled-coil domain-containing protein 63/114
MRAQVEKFKMQGNSSEMNKNKIFQTLQKSIERATNKQKIYTERYNEAIQIINLLKPNLLALFREAGCDQGSGAIGQSLLAQGPTDTNLLQFLGVIEQRVRKRLIESLLKTSCLYIYSINAFFPLFFINAIGSRNGTIT